MSKTPPKIHLEIENFQAHKQKTVTFQGFTVIVGKTNQGKSALLRALMTATLNHWNKSWITNGEKTTTVKVTLEHEGEVNTLQVIKPKNTLIFNGKEYPKIGSKQTEQQKSLGITMDINFDPQFAPLFFVAETPSKQSDLLKKLFNTEKQEIMLSVVNSKTNDATKEINKLDKRINIEIIPKISLAQKLSELEEQYNQNTENMKFLTKYIENLTKKQKATQLNKAINQLVQKQEELKSEQERVIQLLDLNQRINKKQKAIQLNKVINQLIQKQEELAENQEKATQLSDLNQKINKKQKAIQLLTVVNQLVQKQEELKSEQEKATQLITFNQIILKKQKATHLLEIINQLIQKQETLEKWENYKNYLNQLNQLILKKQKATHLLETVNQLIQKQEILEKWINYKGYLNQLNQLVSQKQEKTQLLKTTQDQINQFANTICSCCGQPIHIKDN